MASLAVLALVLGIRHAADSDHVVAVTALAARHRRVGPAALLGLFWGLGHPLTLCVAGGLILAFNLTVPERVGLSLELVVGIALIVVGALNLAGRGGFVSAEGAESRQQGARAFVVGLVHGLAGSAVLALLVLASVRDPWLGGAYLLVFGSGTILGMVLITVTVASPVALLAHRYDWNGATLRLATGALSVAMGAYVMVEVGLALQVGP